MGIENPIFSFSETKYFGASSKGRARFKKQFIKTALKNSNLEPPYKNFDIAKSRTKGISRLEKTAERVKKTDEALTLEIKSKSLHAEEYRLYLEKNQENLKRLKLVEVAHEIQSHPSSRKKAEFNRLNREIYGPVRKDLYLTILSEKKFKIENFKPNDEKARCLKYGLLEGRLFKKVKAKENPLHPEEVLASLNKILKKRFTPVFQLIDDDKNYTASEAQKVLTKIVKELGFDWKIIIADEVSVVTDLAVSRELKLPKDLMRTGRELKRLAIHEIGIHTGRAIAGRKNGGPLLELGTRNHLRAEEGLATICECSVEKDLNNKSFRRIEYRYLVAGLTMGVDGKKRNATEVFYEIVPLLILENADHGQITNEVIEQSLDEAYRHIENAFRGTNWTTRGMAYLKLKVYYEGFVDNLNFFKKNLQDLDGAFALAMLGKYNHTKTQSIKDALFLIDLHKRS